MRLVLFAVFGAIMSFQTLAQETTQFSHDEAAIREVVSEYVIGWRTGDAERLAKIFEPDHGHIIWRSSNDEGETIQSMTLGNALQNRRANEGYGQPYTIEHLDIVDGVLAVVRFNVLRPGKGSYVDYFTLYKRNGEWKIVTKAFAYRRAP